MENTKKIWIDCDPGIDDSLALMLAHASEELGIVGISTVAGNVGAEKGARNARMILDYLGETDVPVYIGERTALDGTVRDAEDTHGSDGLGNSGLSGSDTVLPDGGVDALLGALEQEENLTLLAIGPLTNLAKALEKDPETLRKAKKLIIMGGAFKSHGNCSPVAEFNIWADPKAAAKVFEEIGIPIVMTGLDVTREVVLTPNYRTLIRKIGGELGEMIYRMTQFYEDFHWDAEKTLGVVINDPLALAPLIAPECVSGEDYYVRVITEGETEGMTMVDEQGILGRPANVHVLTRADGNAFLKLFLTRLFPDETALIDRVFSQKRYGA